MKNGQWLNNIELTEEIIELRKKINSCGDFMVIINDLLQSVVEKDKQRQSSTSTYIKCSICLNFINNDELIVINDKKYHKSCCSLRRC